MGAGFAVIAVRTSSVLPGAESRILEIAVEQLDDDGRAQACWSAICAAADGSLDDSDAHTFSDVMPALFDLLRGRTLVAHNASAIVLFLDAELVRAGLHLDEHPRALSTLRLSRLFSPEAGRSLRASCAAAGINEAADIERSAVAAAHATAQLFARYRSEPQLSTAWVAAIKATTLCAWPVAVRRAGSRSALGDHHHEHPPVRSVSAAQPTEPELFLQRTAQNLSSYTGPAEHHEYLALVDSCLAVGAVQENAATALSEVAEKLGISRFTCETVNQEYFADMAHVACASGPVNREQLSILVAVGHLLDIPASVISETIAAATAEARALSGNREAPAPNFSDLLRTDHPGTTGSTGVHVDHTRAERLPPRHLAPRVGGIVL